MSNQKFFYAVVQTNIDEGGLTEESRIEYHIGYSPSGSRKDIKETRERIEKLQAFSKSIPISSPLDEEKDHLGNKINPLDLLIDLKAEIKFYCEQVYGIKNCEQVEVPLDKIGNKEVIANIW